jgi:hypothetical protein
MLHQPGLRRDDVADRGVRARRRVERHRSAAEVLDLSLEAVELEDAGVEAGGVGVEEAPDVLAGWSVGVAGGDDVSDLGEGGRARTPACS